MRQKRRRRSRKRKAILASVVVVVVGAAGVVAWRSLKSSAQKATPEAAGLGAGRSHGSSTGLERAAAATTLPGNVVTGATPSPADWAGGERAAWVVAENKKPGTTAWEIHGTPPGHIAGFANMTSAQAGQTVTLYVDTDASSFRVDAYRVGYYGGAGGRLVWQSAPVSGTAQPTCPVTSGTNMVACDNWSPSLSFTVTAAFVQGDYLLKLVGDGGQESYVPLTVWDPSSDATYLVENDIYTWQAWNDYGGYDLYAGVGACPNGGYPVCNRARVVSFDRPYAYGDGAGDFLANELPLVRFVEEEGLNVTYATSADFQQDPSFLLQHRAVLSLGHDECWSLPEREAAVAAQQHGVNLVFFGASAILRHVRMQSSPLGPDREEVDYRDSAEDPLDGHGNPLEVTGNTWSSPPASWSEVPFVGAEYTGYVEPGASPAPMVVADAGSWLFAGTGLEDGSKLPGLIWSDFDQYEPGLSPSNIEILAHSPLPRSEVQTSVSDPASDVTYYSDQASGAGVFDSGTVAWISDMSRSGPLRQMTANLLHLFGRGPAGRIEPSTPDWSRFY